MQLKSNQKKLKQLSKTLEFKSKIAGKKLETLLKFDNQSENSSDTQELNKGEENQEIGEGKVQAVKILCEENGKVVQVLDKELVLKKQEANEQGTQLVKSEDQKSDDTQNATKKQPIQKKSKMQQLYDSRPYIKGARRYYREGQVYYRTATKFFQPQKHYLHKEQSAIMKTWSYGSGKTSNKISLVAWNINGIRTALHKPQVCEYIKKTDADILCIVQVKINQYNYKRKPVKLSGYEGYWNFCKCSSGYSGIAIFSKFEPISAYEDFQQKEYSQQGRVLTLEYEKFYLVVAYVPAAGQNLERLQYKVNEYEKVFYKHCARLLEKKHVIVAGDLNVCHTNLDMHVPKIIRKHQGKHPSSTKPERTNFQTFLNLGFVDTFRRLNPQLKKYSWYNIKRLGRQKNLGKRLDYFLVDQDFIKAVTRSNVMSHIQGSDHCPIQMELDLSLLDPLDEKQKQRKRKIRRQYVKNHILPAIKLQQKQSSKDQTTSKSNSLLNNLSSQNYQQDYQLRSKIKKQCPSN